MGLTFQKELNSQISEYLVGVDKLKLIDKLLTENEAWRKEAFLHVRKLLYHMVKKKASDMDFGGYRANKRIWYRTFGTKKPEMEVPAYGVNETNILALAIISEAQKEILFEKRSIDFAFTLVISENEPIVRYRGNVYMERNELAVNFRMINQKLFPLSSLQLPDPIVKRLDLQHEKSGLFLVTGITGSGKSSTLDTIVDMNNHNNEAQMIILGNPIEFIHQSDKCIISHREVGADVLSFNRGCIEALRQDPDIIVVGEMRDPQTIATVLEVTDSGHKVFSTLHTSSTVDSIHRMIAEFPPDEQERIRYRLADVLKVVISQKLVPNKKGSVTLAKEILAVDSSVQAAIRNGNIAEIFQMITEGKDKGMYTMQQDLYRLYRSGIIEAKTAMSFANNKKVMANLLKFQKN
ncbi:MAG: Flp pilus assembly complex ATPase component TadA [Candidatus Cloacimonetes bacterium]|nr:Flp pilus assembly complex ATPase component TadA [Candidatus Cloacimonadota bacterium]MCF7814702.1 Flp pilus assembly complex ATPase component TadA [Candidatus Cloacimonadota bacterium]MCF7868177.1 Flp pilus assembly complex ATPase component TadA [Candidatus Cloacimonadota bacterium]MCF7884471.1 Flp pilus assembly complex ATPase component TadA [Candidatus Cloacimonadota bacterium]